MKVETQQLKAFIIDADLVTKEKLEEAEKEAKKRNKKLEEILIEKNLITEDRVIKLKAYVLGIPFVNLEKETVDSKILQIIPEPIARKHNIIAYKKRGNELEVAMLDPEDLQTIEFIKKKANLTILPRLTSKKSIQNLLKQYQKSLEAEFGEIIKKETEEISATAKPTEEKEIPEKDLKKAAEELPIIKIVDTLLKHAVLQDASDIHIEPGEKETVVRYRIDGILHDTMTLPPRVHNGIVARIKVLSNLKIDEHRLPQDGRFKIETPEYKISFRVSILPVYDGEKIVMRLLREDSKGFTLESLGLRGNALEIVHKYIKRPVGMILVTGPTGCGKTTTLYAIMDIINTPGVNISTIEDPIEYRMPRINQTQVKPNIGLTFANGLRSLVRQDPDIIMVGEIRDEETAGLAVNAALTGHLVLSTLHTNSAAGAMPRLADMQVKPFLTASTLNAIIAQRLVRKLCPENRIKYRLTKSEIASLEKDFNLKQILDILKQEKIIPAKSDWEDIDFFKPKSSPDCPDGYKGRIGIFEVLEVTNEIKELIVKESPIDKIEETARQQKMITMFEDGFIKAVQGITSIEEVLRVTRE